MEVARPLTILCGDVGQVRINDLQYLHELGLIRWVSDK